MPSPPAGRPMKRVMTLNQKQIRNPAGEDTFSLAPDEAGTVTGGRTYRLDSSEKTKIPYDSTRWARKPLPPVSTYTLEPLFLHILKAAVSPVIAKPVQGSQLKFSYARNVSCYKLVIHHSRGDGTAPPAPSVASTRTVRRSGEHRSGSTVRRVRGSYGRNGLGRGCVASRRNPPLAQVFSMRTNLFSRSAETFFGTVPFLWRRTRALHRSGTGTLYPEHGSGIKELSHGNTSYLQRS